jgi:response regulator RpfG family c-di-GMP phosphodiesterase
MTHPRSSATTVVAILGANTVVENALSQLLEGEGYATRVLKPFPMGEAVEKQEMPLGGVDLVVLAPSLSTSECEAFLAARRATSHRRRRTATSPIPVIVLCSPMREAQPLLEEEEAARSVSWPTSPERLVSEIEAALLESSRLAARREKSSRKREDEIPR